MSEEPFRKLQEALEPMKALERAITIAQTPFQIASKLVELPIKAADTVSDIIDLLVPPA